MTRFRPYHAQTEQELTRHFGGHGLVRANGQRGFDFEGNGAAGDGVGAFLGWDWTVSHGFLGGVGEVF